MEKSATTVGIVGGTGDLGAGLARRLARAGFKVIIGSRNESQAQAAGEALKGTRRFLGLGCFKCVGGE